MQAGKVNSIAALHDAHSKQLLNPLKMRKAPQGAAANPVIRQRSVAQQAKHKQHFADTLRRNSEAEAATLANEQGMQSPQSMPAGQSAHGMSPDFQQQQARDGAGQFGAYHRAQLEPYGGTLASSKSEPHGQLTLPISDSWNCLQSCNTKYRQQQAKSHKLFVHAVRCCSKMFCIADQVTL